MSCGEPKFCTNCVEKLMQVLPSRLYPDNTPMIADLIKACIKMRTALESGGWGHSILCNYSGAPIIQPCNCGLNDMLWALKQLENQTL